MIPAVEVFRTFRFAGEFLLLRIEVEAVDGFRRDTAEAFDGVFDLARFAFSFVTFGLAVVNLAVQRLTADFLAVHGLTAFDHRRRLSAWT